MKKSEDTFYLQAKSWLFQCDITVPLSVLLSLLAGAAIAWLIPGYIIHCIRCWDPAYTGVWHGLRNAFVLVLCDVGGRILCRSLFHKGVHILQSFKTCDRNSRDIVIPEIGFLLRYRLWFYLRPFVREVRDLAA